MAKSSRQNKTDETKAEAKAEPQRAARADETFAPPEVVERPTEEDRLGPQDEGDLLPEMEVAEEQGSGGVSDVGLGEDGLNLDVSPEVLDDGLDSRFDPDDLAEFLDQVEGSGGADGRNPANDAGGMTQPEDGVPGDFDSPIGGNPYRGLEGSTGALSEEAQATLKEYQAEAQQAANNGDFDKANEVAAKTEQFLIDLGAQPPPSAAPAAEAGEPQKDYDLISNFGAGNSAPKQVWDSKKGEVVMVDADTETNNRPAGSEYQQYQETGVNTSGNQEGAAPETKSGVNEDRDVQDELDDVTPELTALLADLKMKDTLGGNIDDNPADDSAGMTYDGPPPSVDATDVVANYGAEHFETEPDPSRVSAADAVPDEEFFEA